MSLYDDFFTDMFSMKQLLNCINDSKENKLKSITVNNYFNRGHVVKRNLEDYIGTRRKFSAVDIIKVATLFEFSKFKIPVCGIEQAIAECIEHYLHRILAFEIPEPFNQFHEPGEAIIYIVSNDTGMHIKQFYEYDYEGNKSKKPDLSDYPIVIKITPLNIVNPVIKKLKQIIKESKK